MRSLSLASTVATAAVLAGCGFGPGGSSEGVVELTVTRDYGSVPMASAELEDPPGTETALSLLDRETDLETRFGGGFVNSIDGIEGSAVEDGRNFDWFFYVNGVEAGIGSAEYELKGGDRVWWDHRDWTDAMRVPAVVGSWPEPFLQASADEPVETEVDCLIPSTVCRDVEVTLEAAGVSATPARLGGREDSPRVLVGIWDDIEGHPSAGLLAEGPDESGIFARFADGPEGTELVALDDHAEEAARLGAGAGLVAATSDGEAQPTWLVTGVDEAGVEAAAAALTEENLADRYAIAVGAGSDAVLDLPVSPEG